MPEVRRGPERPDPDLLEYVLVPAGGAARLVPVAEAVVGLVGDGSIRLLDAVLLVRAGAAARVDTAPLDGRAGLAGLAAVADGGVLLSRHDIDLAALTLAPYEAALLLLVEDRWAGSLAEAARLGGARGLAGERIGRDRVLRSWEGPRPEDLLVRGPGEAPLVDRVAQARQLLRMVDRGLLPLDRYEVQRRRVLGG